jgi:peptidoglycan/LPS O-acetylase OafA/YrhL
MWLIGFVFYRHWTRPAASALLVLLPICILSFRPEWARLSDPFALVTVTLAAFTLSVAPFAKVPYRVAKIMDFLGDVSYPLYLIHIPVFVILWNVGLHNPYFIVAIALIVSAVLVPIDDLFKKKLRRMVVKSEVKAIRAPRTDEPGGLSVAVP